MNEREEKKTESSTYTILILQAKEILQPNQFYHENGQVKRDKTSK